MLEEILKSSGSALTKEWQEPVSGVKVCRFEQTLSQEQFPISISPIPPSCRAEILFCESGTLLVYPEKGGIFSVNGQDILLLSHQPQIRLMQITASLQGILLSADLDSPWFRHCFQMGGSSSPDLQEIQTKLAENEGCVLLSGVSWNHPFFSLLQTIPKGEQGGYCLFKYAELLYLLKIGHPMVKPQKEIPIDGALARTVVDMRVYMESHLNEKLTIESLSRQFYISPTAFKDCFRKIYGIPVHRWLQTRRIQRAAELLRTTSADIAMIARSVGYEGLSQFNLVFKRQFGMTPRQYRKLSALSADR